ncbi:hypothetical protein DFH07DRAFT_776566 [Mycena maculata]|uniref:Uncharacterized protein n=1 Tax=Mycena maculata TaxID=230809 RepID=A0AAD7ILD7_9AGAR|nr:hypothetical protein DFH07DRAFT_776566 [Mycena maculata]
MGTLLEKQADTLYHILRLLETEISARCTQINQHDNFRSEDGQISDWAHLTVQAPQHGCTQFYGSWMRKPSPIFACAMAPCPCQYGVLAKEEVEILAQEFRQAIQGFTKMETIWTALAQQHNINPGKQAYALKTASLYSQMHTEGEKKFVDVGGTWPSAGVSLTQHIKSERPDGMIDWDAVVADNN